MCTKLSNSARNQGVKFLTKCIHDDHASLYSSPGLAQTVLDSTRWKRGCRDQLHQTSRTHPPRCEEIQPEIALWTSVPCSVTTYFGHVPILGFGICQSPHDLTHNRVALRFSVWEWQLTSASSSFDTPLSPFASQIENVNSDLIMRSCSCAVVFSIPFSISNAFSVQQEIGTWESELYDNLLSMSFRLQSSL